MGDTHMRVLFEWFWFTLKLTNISYNGQITISTKTIHSIHYERHHVFTSIKSQQNSIEQLLLEKLQPRRITLDAYFG